MQYRKGNKSLGSQFDIKLVTRSNNAKNRFDIQLPKVQLSSYLPNAKSIEGVSAQSHICE